MKTNAMRILDSLGVEYEVKQHSQSVFTAEEAARERGVRVSQIVKTMVAEKSDGRFCLALVPGHRRLSLKKLEQALGDAKVQLASRKEVVDVTGYRVGAVSPIGVRRRKIPVLIDPAILKEEFVSISSGTPDAGIELRSSVLLRVLDAALADISEYET